MTRNADIDADALYDEDLDYREFMADLMKQRRKLAPIRLEMSGNLDIGSVMMLDNYLGLEEKYVFHSSVPLDFSFVFQIQDMLRKNENLFYAKRTPQKSTMFQDGRSMIEQIKEGDKLLSYPYESIRPFLRLLTEAAEDENVVSIKMTLYRLAKQSKVIEALIEAAENGKEVVVLVELRAGLTRRIILTGPKCLRRPAAMLSTAFWTQDPQQDHPGCQKGRGRNPPLRPSGYGKLQ